MKRFAGKTILVTGGSSGIGLATARRFIELGARVIVTGRDSARLEAAAQGLGPRLIRFESDAGDMAAVKSLARFVVARDIMLDAVFINAGTLDLEHFPRVTEARWERVFAVNVKGPYFLIQALIPRLNEGASIILNGGLHPPLPVEGNSVHRASRAALASLAVSLSAELAGRHIRVNVVSPGACSTPLYENLDLDENQRAGLAAFLASRAAVGRLADPEEIASAVTYLAASESSFIVGTELVVDGGTRALV